MLKVKYNISMLFIKIKNCFRLLIIFIFCNIINIEQSHSIETKDCKFNAFYIKNIKTDITRENIQKAKFDAENEALYKSFSTLISRLTPKNKKVQFEIDIKKFVQFIKINKEENSQQRYIANFDICFNRNSLINFFKKKNLPHAEIYSLPITVFPLYRGPQGYVFLDKTNKWQNLWETKIRNYDSLLRFKITKENLSLKRNLDPKNILNSDTNEILKIIQLNEGRRLMIVISEPILLKNGKYAIKTQARLYNQNGKFDSALYSNKKSVSSYKNIEELEKVYLEDEVSNILEVFSESWKKNNLFKDNILTFVNLYVPVNLNTDWSNFIQLVDNLPYIQEFSIIALKSNVGKVRITFQGSTNTFLTLLNEKGLKIQKLNDEFILLK